MTESIYLYSFDQKVPLGFAFHNSVLTLEEAYNEIKFALGMADMKKREKLKKLNLS